MTHMISRCLAFPTISEALESRGGEVFSYQETGSMFYPFFFLTSGAIKLRHIAQAALRYADIIFAQGIPPEETVGEYWMDPTRTRVETSCRNTFYIDHRVEIQFSNSTTVNVIREFCGKWE